VKLSVALVLASSVAFAAAPIGVATANGQFQLEGSRIWGNSTLFEGAKIETSDASSELALANGVKVQLGARSSARVWKGWLELERGTGQVTAAKSFPMRVGGVTIEGTRYSVGVLQNARFEVSSMTGSTRVMSASVPVGQTIRFAMQQSITRAGCLVYKGNGFILQVDDSPEVLQLAGGALAQNVGNRVEVSGATAATAPTISPAVSVLNVTSLTLRATGGCLTTAAALNAQTSVPGTPGATPAATPNAPAPTVARTGMSTGAKVGIIGAVAGGGAGAALALGGKKSSTSP